MVASAVTNNTIEKKTDGSNGEAAEWKSSEEGGSVVADSGKSWATGVVWGALVEVVLRDVVAAVVVTVLVVRVLVVSVVVRDDVVVTVVGHGSIVSSPQKRHSKWIPSAKHPFVYLPGLHWLSHTYCVLGSASNSHTGHGGKSPSPQKRHSM